VPRLTAALQDSLLELIGEVHGLLELDEFRSGLLAALRRAVPADWISLNDLGAKPGATVVLIDPEFPPQTHQLFARYAHQNPLLARYQHTLDGRPYRLSDVTTTATLHNTELYRQFYGPIGLEHQIAFTLPHEPERVLALALSRRTPDFSDDERELLSQARPFLIQSYRNAIEYSRLQTELDERRQELLLPVADPRLARALTAHGITAREAEILSWVATGRSDRAIGRQTNLRERTVQTHLHRCYRKLGVHTRADAIALAWSLTKIPESAHGHERDPVHR
jgi:DNA-binding CsgD family transcriptional regulator